MRKFWWHDQEVLGGKIKKFFGQEEILVTRSGSFEKKIKKFGGKMRKFGGKIRKFEDKIRKFWDMMKFLGVGSGNFCSKIRKV